MTWALEGGIVTADAMNARGYGSGKRSNYQIFSLKRQDIFMLAFMGILASCVIALIAGGGTAASYTPVMEITPLSGLRGIGFAAYALFLLLPTVLYVKEAIVWRISRSGI